MCKLSGFALSISSHSGNSDSEGRWREGENTLLFWINLVD